MTLLMLKTGYNWLIVTKLNTLQNISSVSPAAHIYKTYIKVFLNVFFLLGDDAERPLTLADSPEC